MGAFHHPAPRAMARDEFFRLFLLPAAAHVGLIVARHEVFVDRSSVVSSIQAQMLRLLCCRLGPTDDQPIERGTQQLYIVTIGAIDDQCQRNAGAIGQ